MRAAQEGGKKGLKVSIYIIASAVLGGLLAALQNPELAEALQNNPTIVASIPIAAAIINIIIVAIEKFREGYINGKK